ncbi:hypothetical protein [Nonomuraea candida]|uniref:hypothetical protein n=1 Tax=Nonomuraea candida TaxID=359159 RepID=UPI0005BA895D|nr:hypothetical protein [Nonomuraea candida]
MADAEQPPSARRRRTRERGQGQREKRVNVRLSDAEHGVLETAATRHGQTLAGYVSAAALAAARDELPVDAREACFRLFAMQADLRRLRAAHGIDSSELAGALFAMHEALEEAAEEFINLSRRARGQRARPATLRVSRAPAAPPATTAAVPQQPAAAIAPATSTPDTARAWMTQLDTLARQLEDDSTTVAAQHWNHHRLYDALVRAVVALGHAHPGGLDRLAPRR